MEIKEKNQYSLVSFNSSKLEFTIFIIQKFKIMVLNLNLFTVDEYPEVTTRIYKCKSETGFKNTYKR